MITVCLWLKAWFLNDHRTLVCGALSAVSYTTQFLLAPCDQFLSWSEWGKESCLCACVLKTTWLSGKLRFLVHPGKTLIFMTHLAFPLGAVAGIVSPFLLCVLPRLELTWCLPCKSRLIFLILVYAKYLPHLYMSVYEVEVLLFPCF